MPKDFNFIIKKSPPLSIRRTMLLYYVALLLTASAVAAQETPLNETLPPEPTCIWAQSPYYNETIGEWSCVRWVDAPGLNFKWSTYAFGFATWDWVLAILFGAALIDHIRRYVTCKEKRSYRHPLIDPSMYAIIVPVIGYLMMGFSMIDPWAFFGNLTIAQFLYMYCLGYGLILATPSFYAIYSLHEYIALGRRNTILNRKFAWWATLLLFAICAFASIGYISFGLALAKSFEKNPDPNSKLALQGDNLVYTMYAIILVFSISTSIAFISVMRSHIRTTKQALKDQIYGLKGEAGPQSKHDYSVRSSKQVDKATSRHIKEESTKAQAMISKYTSLIFRMSVFSAGTVILCVAFYLINLLRYKMSTDKGIPDHMDFHACNRIIECLFGHLILGTILWPAYNNTHPLSGYIWLVKKIFGCESKRTLFKHMDHLGDTNTEGTNSSVALSTVTVDTMGE